VGNGGPAAGGGVVVAWRRRGPACLAFLLFFIFLCCDYLGGARQRAGDAVSLDGRRPLFFAVRHILRTTKAYVVRCLSLRRTTKVFARQKCVVRPLPCARAETARQRLCRAGSDLFRAPVAHGKACESGSVPMVYREDKPEETAPVPRLSARRLADGRGQGGGASGPSPDGGTGGGRIHGGGRLSDWAVRALIRPPY
jgi:uncharacterized membrane protein YgcG